MISSKLTIALSLIIGAALVGVYILVYAAKRKTNELTLSEGALVFIHGMGILGGVKIMSLVCENNITCGQDVDHVYIFLGGLAVTWVSVAEFRKRLK